MTVPIIGHPDWQLISARRANILYGATPLVTAGGTTKLGPFSVVGSASIALRVDGITNSGTIMVKSGYTNGLDSNDEMHEWNLKQGTSMWVRFPVVRNWLQVNLTAGSVVLFSMTLDIIPIDVQQGIQYYQTSSAGVASTNVNINAGASIVAQPQWLSPGPAMIWLTNSGAPNNVVYEIKKYDAQGNETDIYARWTSIPAAGLVQSIDLPQTGWILKITNNTAGAITTSYSILPRGASM